MLVKIVHCDVVYRTVDFGMPSFFFVDFIVLFLRTNRVPTYQKDDFSPSRTDLAVKLLKRRSTTQPHQLGRNVGISEKERKGYPLRT